MNALESYYECPADIHKTSIFYFRAGFLTRFFINTMLSLTGNKRAAMTLKGFKKMS